MIEQHAEAQAGSSKSFFLYGSLAQGNIHFQKFFQENSIIEKNVFVRGNVYRLEVGFPVLCLQERPYNHLIPGDLVICEISDLLLNLMDEFHGYSRKTPEKSLYLRTEIEVLTENGPQKAITYVMNPAKIPKTAVLIENGNWIEDLSQNPPFTLKLNDREKEYVRKLGQSSGRDIVPIQLDLYRALMNMGLIVDKGRRLALSKFGQEVFRFLE
jgi:gamma-glutamylcyclotransferase (GGCT)/AIG2-like uncharacterized protein YtfP